MQDTFTLTKQVLNNGCLAVHVAHVVRAAVKAAAAQHGRTPSERVTARFTVKVDGTTTRLTRKDALEKLLSCISAGSVCRVFRNAGFGATIDFDTPQPPQALVPPAARPGDLAFTGSTVLPVPAPAQSVQVLVPPVAQPGDVAFTG